ncbi:hypothetical protein AGMMS4956_14600 [Bacteroidia bacterium]|nr:hypothetical protein AGMMS4956_14600 [Bacteroidia bacterium]
MSATHKPFTVKVYQVALPIIIGLGVVMFMFWKEFFPPVKVNSFEYITELHYKAGDTLCLTNNPALYSRDTLLAVNAKRLLSKAPVGVVMLINKEPALTVIEHSGKNLRCVVLRQVTIKGGELFSIHGTRLHAPNLGDVLRQTDMSWRFMLFIVLAFLLMMGRDAGYTARLYVLSEGKISWLHCLRVILLWEFTSTVTPGAVGGTGIATLYIAKEGINVGKSSAIVMATSLLDEMYFVIMFPLLLLIISSDALFGTSTQGFITVALIGYCLKLGWVMLLVYGLFFNPRGLRWLFIKVFSLPLLRKWKQAAIKAGDDVVESAKDLRHKSIAFWGKAAGATILSWTSRYWVVNALFLAFFVVHDHFLIFARQLVMWIMMLVSPTPGGSGFAEYVFKEFLGDLIPNAGLVVILALLWRFISYYMYLILGVLILPSWIRKKFSKKIEKS